MGRKPIYFSSYINENDISTDPTDIDLEGGIYRYSIRIPFIDKNQRNGNKAIVIMKNPSKAGKYDPIENKKLSDDTIYRVLDYLYKQERNFSEVIILNLFAAYVSVFNDENITNQVIFGNGNTKKNNQVITDTISSLGDGDIVIAAWGGYPERKDFREKYRTRINEVMGLLKDIPLWRVGGRVITGKHTFPQHGLQWFDFEELSPYQS